MDHHANDDSDDASSQSSCATFSSDESNTNDYMNLFYENEGLGDCYVKTNSEYAQKIKIKPYYGFEEDHEYGLNPSPCEWVELGRNIGQNTHLKKVLIIVDHRVDGYALKLYDAEDDSDLFSKNNMEKFCGGLSKNQSISSLSFCNFSLLGRMNFLQSLHPFVIENCKLSELRLNNCSFSSHDLQMLANALGRRINPESIRKIVLRPWPHADDITDQSVPYIVEMANHCPRLKTLRLGRSTAISNQGCVILATLITNQQSMLKCLELDLPEVSDEGALAIANSLSNNSTLERLSLQGECPLITNSGWDNFARVLCDTSSIQATYESNHTLQRMGMYIEDGDCRHLEYLKFSLTANMQTNKIMVARQKIFHVHLNCGNFNLTPFILMNMKLLTLVLGWIGRDIYKKSGVVPQSSCAAFYRIVRNFPELCGYPSADRIVRLRLEAENASLKDGLATLRQQIEKLKSENEELCSNKRSRTV